MNLDATFPKISVITPSFNQGLFLEKTILSVLNQNYPNLEYMIIDGGSTDNSVEIIKKYEKHLSYWISEKDNGQSDALNKGFNKSTGDILCWLNSDDYFLPNVLNIIANYEWNSNIGAVAGVGHIVDLNDEIVYTPEYYDPINTQSLFKWTNGKDFMQPACFFTKQAWEDCGPLNSDLYFCMDVDFWINISKKYEIKRIKESLAHAYTHTEAKTTAEVDKMKIETYLMIASHGGISESREGLIDFYEKIMKKKISSDQVMKHFSLKKLIRMVLKKM